MKPIILASASPRRALLLKMAGIDFIQVPSGSDEEWIEGSTIENSVIKVAEAKAVRTVAINTEPSVIIAADTVVVLGETIFGKPCDRSEAKIILKKLSGNSHDVITGICILDTEIDAFYCGYEKTRVFFRDLQDYEIEAYVTGEECLDKAGAYGIQGRGAFLVDRIDGCYYNVVGLPLNLLRVLLLQAGIDIWRTNH